MASRVRNGKLLHARAIRDTVAVLSSEVDVASIGSVLFVAESTLNQSSTLQYQGSMDGVT